MSQREKSTFRFASCSHAVRGAVVRTWEIQLIKVKNFPWLWYSLLPGDRLPVHWVILSGRQLQPSRLHLNYTVLITFISSLTFIEHVELWYQYSQYIFFTSSSFLLPLFNWCAEQNAEQYFHLPPKCLAGCKVCALVLRCKQDGLLLSDERAQFPGPHTWTSEPILSMEDLSFQTEFCK